MNELVHHAPTLPKDLVINNATAIRLDILSNVYELACGHDKFWDYALVEADQSRIRSPV